MVSLLATVVCSYLNHSDIDESIDGDDTGDNVENEESQLEKPVNIIQQISHAIQNIFVNLGNYACTELGK